MTQFWFAASTEEFTPTQMLEQARAADRAGFDAIGSSDHFHSWFPQGKGSAAWVFLPAAGQVVADTPSSSRTAGSARPCSSSRSSRSL